MKGLHILVRQMVRKMADVFKSFNTTVNTVTYGLGGTRSNPVSGSFATGGNAKKTVTVKQQKPGFFASLFGFGESEKYVAIEPKTSKKATVTVKDYTGAGAYNTLTDNVPERRYETTQVGEKIIVREIANAASSWWSILTGNK